MGDAEYLQAMMHIVLPICFEYAPDIVIVSAGFSAAPGDVAGTCVCVHVCVCARACVCMSVLGT